MIASGEWVEPGFVEVVDQVAFFAVDDVLFQLFLDRQIRTSSVLGPVVISEPSGKSEMKCRQRIEAFSPPVVDQIQRGVPLLIGDSILRQNLRGVDDRSDQTGLAQLMQEGAVQHDPRRRL